MLRCLSKVRLYIPLTHDGLKSSSTLDMGTCPLKSPSLVDGGIRHSEKTSEEGNNLKRCSNVVTNRLQRDSLTWLIQRTQRCLIEKLKEA